MRLRNFSVFALLALLAAPPASATPVTVVLSGTIDGVEDNGGVTDGSVGPGTPFLASFSFDDAAGDTDPDPAVGIYDFSSLPPGSSQLQLGSYTFASGGAGFSIELFDGGGSGDELALSAQLASASGPFSATAVGANYEFVLIDAAEIALPSDALASVSWGVAGWSSIANLVVYMAFDTPDLVLFQGRVDDIAVVPVPEPVSGVLLAHGLVALGVRRHLARTA